MNVINKNDINWIKIQIDNDLKYAFSDSIKDEDKELLLNYLEHLTESELILFQKILKQVKDNRKYYGLNNYKITKNAIKLASKIYNDTEIKVFPYIEKVASKGWSISDGTYAFSMPLLENKLFGKVVYSWDRASDCLKKSSRLDWTMFDNDIIIGVK